LVLAGILVAALARVPAAAQCPGICDSGQSLPDVLEAIQRARVTTRVLFITAHPDDEAATPLSYGSHLGADMALLTLTRGEGGQNALGPEQGPQLAIIRTSELLAATRGYGARLYFTRAPDFGYSKTLDETLRNWGDAVLGDMVRVIRTFRPHIIINGWDSTHSGHGNHQASGYLTPRALTAAADPKAFPEQLAEGLKPWRASLLLQPTRSDDPNGWTVPADEISPIWGKTYREMGLEGLANHRSQGLPGFLNAPFLRRSYALARADGGKLDPAALAVPLSAAPGLKSTMAAPYLQQADGSLVQARAAALSLDWRECVGHLAAAGLQLARLREQLTKQPSEQASDALWELHRVRERIDAALVAAAALHIEAQADRSELVAGETFSVRAEMHPRASLLDELGPPSLMLPAGWSVTKEETEPNGAVRLIVSVPAEAKTPHGSNDWMLPFPPPLVRAQVRAVVGGYAFDASAAVVAQRVTSTRVDTLPLTVVPAVTLALEPQQFVVAESRPPKRLELLARVHSYSTVPAKVRVGVDAPEGWRVDAPRPLEFSSPGDQLVRFVAVPPAKVAAGNYALKAWASRDGEKFGTSVEPLPSLPTQLWSEPAVASVHVFEVTVPEGLRIGYIAAENDPLPATLRQLGVHVELLDPVGLAFSDLRPFDAIAIGIRAYELRQDLMRANQRLLDYAAAGGTLVVQYQRENVWTALKPAPYPASMTQPAARVTDENSPVRFLVPDHPALNFPNRITQRDFQGWVQERGLYFWSRFDPHYQPLLAMRDPGEEEANGGLVYARVGKGVYIYTGLALFRQLPEGISGAYRLFINLLSQSKAR
jgi:LmbE family N-acetylglucosaminyl deacetylase